MAPNSSDTRKASRSESQGAAPTTELGAVSQTWGGSGQVGSGFGVPSWGSIAYDELEIVPELQFPQSVRTYRTMMNDSQVEGLYAGSTFPVRRYKWMIDPNGCDPARVKTLSGDINLPIKGNDPDEQRARSKKRFVFDRHVADALRAIIYGFYDFEQVGYIGDDGLWHLRKLAPRPPATIQEIILSDDGGLLMIRQNISNGRTPQIGLLPEIPVDRLVHYSWEQEGANWHGRSMLRSIYRNWLIKDRLLRIDAIKHERNGVGMPVARGSQGMTDPELEKLGKLARSYKAGEDGGAAIPFGADLTLEGVRGHVPDTVASINMHNEEMSRRFLMMFIQLGSTLHGSRSLGKDFVDYFQLAQEQLANWFLDIFNEHVIEDYWDWNYGENEEHTPFLTYERNDDPRFAAADLAVLIQNGVIQVDDEIEQSVRESMDLPSRDAESERTFIPGHEPVDSTTPPGDQPGQPSTQPGNADPETPGSEQSTSPDVKARRQERDRAATVASPPERSGSFQVGGGHVL